MIDIKERINLIHNRIMIVDAHLDLAGDVFNKRKEGKRKVIESYYLDSFKAGGIDVVVSSLFIDDNYLPEMALRYALDQISALLEDIEESREKIMLCKGYNDILNAKAKGKQAILLSFEGVEPIGNDLSLLRIFYELGVRILGLCWSRRNYAADGCSFSSIKEDKGGGLTDFGIELVKKAEELGMIIDVSHINDQGFFDTVKTSQGAIIASHSNCRTLSHIKRNLTDEQIKAIASSGGVIGINAVSIIASDDEKADVDILVEHIKHIKNLVGVKHIGLGFDLCDQILNSTDSHEITIDGICRTHYDLIQGHRNLYKLTEALLSQGFEEAEIEMIYGKNFLNVFQKYLG